MTSVIKIITRHALVLSLLINCISHAMWQHNPPLVFQPITYADLKIAFDKQPTDDAHVHLYFVPDLKGTEANALLKKKPEIQLQVPNDMRPPRSTMYTVYGSQSQLRSQYEKE